ncbi:MAG: nucleoside kinase [Muribaculaceae bacterium]|nr:nucleoside kinase [Muribaculaceae bacterium]
MKIYSVNLKRYVEIEGGETLLAIYGRIRDEFPADFTPICAYVNNKNEDLSFPVFMPKMVEYLDESTPSGTRVAVRSLCMMLYKAVTELMPGRILRIEHSISHGYYCRILDMTSGMPVTLTPMDIMDLENKMHELGAAALPFERKERLTTDVKELFRKQGLNDKVLLLDSADELYTVFYTLDGLCDSYYGPLAPDTSYLKVFSLQPFKQGFLLLGRDPNNPAVPATPLPQEKMYQAFTDYLRFNRIIGVSTVGELNKAVMNKRTADVINVAEAMHDKLLGRISDEIKRRHDAGGARIVLISGPSSSGKTTSTKRLAIQLMTNLIVPKMISLDDYFVDREKTPLDADGEYDYESLYALDLERFNSDLSRLLKGEEVNIPTYSFELGKRIDKDKRMRLGAKDVLLIEGIHGLNEKLTEALPREKIFKIYVSALTTLRIDDHNWISTTDTRLLRRIVRDAKYRHTTAEETIRRWPSVRRGEEKWIFPFQENADATFNSSLIYELGVMKEFAEPVLRGVHHNVPEYAQATRLLKFLSYFDPISLEWIPSTSLLREFLGGSSFKY